LVVHENIYENSNSACLSSPPSPPLPPPPPSIADNELIGDLPLPPPPSPPPMTQCDRESATILTHSISQNVSIAEPSFSTTVQQLAHSLTSPIELISFSKAPDVVSHKSEIATQTTETLRRNSGSVSAKEMTQLNKPSLETSEAMYQNEVPTTGTQSPSNKSIESVELVESMAPWAYSKLWPNEKCAKTTYYDNDNRYLSANASSPITAANTFIGDTGVSLNCSSNEELLANKSELISRLTRKLDVLRSEEMALNRDIASNETLGQQLKTKLKSLGITAQESEKINLHCDETEKVTRLLLSISARLQQIELQINETSNRKSIINENDFQNSIRSERIQQPISQNACNSKSNLCQNDLQQIKDNHQSSISRTDQSSFPSTKLFDEIQLLVMKREKLLIQLEEALQLRLIIDNRSVMIEEKILKKYFKDNNENLNEFIEFIKLKSKLIVDIREIKDKIQLGEKHVYALKTS
jgi:hypothetical protein